MDMVLRSLRMKLRLIVAVCTAVATAAGAAAAVTTFSDYAPATRGFAKEAAKSEVISALQVTTARMGSLQRESNEARLQLNQLRRETLRNARWSRAEQIKTATDGQTRQIIQQQIDQIDDDLQDVNAERERLRFPAP